MLLLGTVAASEPGCGDLSALLFESEVNFLAEQYADGLAVLNAAERSFACGPIPSTELVARFWLARGAFQLAQDDRGGASASFAAAGALAPSIWVDGYGDRLRRHYLASVAWSGSEGTLAAAGQGPAVLFVDGAPVTLPVTTLAGLHLVQAGQGGRATWYAVVDVAEDTVTTVTLPAQVPPPRRARGGRRTGWLVAAGVSGLASGAAAAGALAQDRAMEEATSADAVRAAYGRQVGFATASYTLLGSAAAGFTVWVAR